MAKPSGWPGPVHRQNTLAGAWGYGKLWLNTRWLMKRLPILLLLSVLWTISTLGAQKPDLKGTVLTDAGQPLPNATVLIYTAGPKVGVGTL